MSGSDPATERMIAHLRDIARRVAGSSGDIAAIRGIIEDYPRLDEATRRVNARTFASAEPRGEWVIAANSDSRRRLLYLHGGSWMSGSPDGYRPLAARIARRTGCSVFVLDYRLAPENPFPAGLDDCVDALGWLEGHGPEDSSPASRRVVAGDSAGGNLALATVLKSMSLGAKAPDAVVALSPATDLTWQSPSLRTRADVDPILRPDRLSLVSEAYVQGRERMDHPWVSPVFGDFSGLRNMLIQVGDREVLLDDARRLAALAEGQGVDVKLQVFEHMPHVFHLFAPTVRSAADAIDGIGDFLDAETGPAVNEGADE